MPPAAYGLSYASCSIKQDLPFRQQLVSRKIRARRAIVESNGKDHDGQIAERKNPDKTKAELAMEKAKLYAQQKVQKSGNRERRDSDTEQSVLNAKSEEASQNARVQGVPEVQIETSQGKYKPAVSTWGVYPRPDNISKAYGGGKNLPKGGVKMSPEQEADYKKRISEKLKQYKIKSGLYLDPEDEDMCQQIMEHAQQLMKRGKLTQAISEFSKIEEKISWRSTIGGNSLLQRAICLDSLGESEKAKPLYKQLMGHSDGAIKKQANQMLFGWEAMENLKVDKLKVDYGRELYKGYLTRISQMSSVRRYYKEDMSSDISRTSYLLVASLIAAPLALFALFLFVK